MYSTPNFSNTQTVSNSYPNNYQSFQSYAPHFVTINSTSNINFYGQTSNNIHTTNNTNNNNNKYVSFASIVSESQQNFNTNTNNTQYNNNTYSNYDNFNKIVPNYNQYRSKTPKGNMLQKKKSIIIEPSVSTPTDVYTAQSDFNFVKKKNKKNKKKLQHNTFETFYNNKYNFQQSNSNQQFFNQQNNQYQNNKAIKKQMKKNKSPKNRPSLLHRMVRSTSQFDALNNTKTNQNKLRKSKSLKNLNLSYDSEMKNNGYSSSSSIDSEEMDPIYTNNPYINKKLVKNGFINTNDEDIILDIPQIQNNKSAPNPKQFGHSFNSSRISFGGSKYNSIFDMNNMNNTRNRAQTVDTHNYNYNYNYNKSIMNNMKPLKIDFNTMIINSKNNKKNQETPVFGINANVPPPPTDSPSFEYQSD